uniref:Si:ch211-113e8.11 n=2 Tax=Latimeria chalumnae TaxID=7897 RepID=H3A5B9_LATCH
NCFIAAEVSSDEDSSSSDVAPEVPESSRPPAPTASTSRDLNYLTATRLPAPELGRSRQQSSVFRNPFREEQREKLSVLQKHVQLTVPDISKQGDGRKICLKYRKEGRCRYGTNCKFAHDSDLQLPVQPDPQASQRGSVALAHAEAGCAAEEEQPPGRGKRKPGVGDTLIPPKKALKSYQSQLAKERPWSL